MKLKAVPKISVGVLHIEEISFHLRGDFTLESKVFTNLRATVKRYGDTILFQPEGQPEEVVSEDLHFQAMSDECSILIKDVIIGVNFHWERKEDQTFKGDLKIIKEFEKLTAVNILSLEDYLESVIASEMSATSSEPLLKAHAIISRSWLLAQLNKQEHLDTNYQSIHQTDTEYIRWYDREDHLLYDVCADDHCQRYQGTTKISTGKAVDAVRETRGEVLLYGDEVCDARFSKCCGGIVETFENVWEPEPKKYLVPLFDGENQSIADYDLTKESVAEEFILGSPDALCNTDDAQVLAEVLNDYDQETHDFFRWEVRYTVDELSELVQERSGIDYGTIMDLEPVERGFSGRLIKLKIVGTKRTLTVGKELEIRKILSKSHLYSSAFVVEKQDDEFILKGAGWGHGVGLCQMGAAVMGARGYDYKRILLHYFKNATIEKLYK